MVAESFISLVGFLAAHTANAQTPILALNELPVAKYAAPATQGPTKKTADSFGIDVSARAAAVIDVSSGVVLFEKNAEAAYPIASLTKLMTAMTFLDTKPDLNAEVTVTKEDENTEGAAVFNGGERLSKRELLQALLVGSVNTAANTLARSTGDTDAFLRAMNRKAKSLKMVHATYFDPSGLDPRNQASAKDVAIALRAALSYPEIRSATERSNVSFKGRATGKPYTIQSTNLLLGSFLNKAPFRIVAGKTGSLPEAGFCMAQATRNREGNEVIAVVLGSGNHFARFQDTKALTAWAFDTYEWPRRATAQQFSRARLAEK